MSAKKLDTAAVDKCEKGLPLEMQTLGEPSPELLAAINRIAGESVPAEVVYVRSGKVCNDQYDRSDERFPEGYLKRFAATLPGKALLAMHNKQVLPVGKWLEASVARAADDSLQLVATFYTAKKHEVTDLLRLGIASELSIGFKAAGRVCDLCGGPYDGPKACGHVKGQEYDGKRCTATYGGDLAHVEALEASIVHVPCQYGAQVIGRKGLEPPLFDAFARPEGPPFPPESGDKMEQEKVELYEAKIADLEEKLKVAAAYETRGKWADTFLRAEISRLENTLAGDEKAGEETLKILGPNPTLEQLETCYERAKKAFNAKFGAGMQSLPRTEGGEGGQDAPASTRDTPKPVRTFDPMRNSRLAYTSAARETEG